MLSSGRAYACGELSIADLAISPHTSSFKSLGIVFGRQGFPKAHARFLRMRQQPVVRSDLAYVKRAAVEKFAEQPSPYEGEKMIRCSDRIQRLIRNGFDDPGRRDEQPEGRSPRRALPDLLEERERHRGMEKGEISGLAPLLGAGRHKTSAHCPGPCRVLSIEAQPLRVASRGQTVGGSQHHACGGRSLLHALHRNAETRTEGRQRDRLDLAARRTDRCRPLPAQAAPGPRGTAH